jgi:hypothetical protein
VKIIWQPRDEQMAANVLYELGVQYTQSDVEKLLKTVERAYEQQLSYEMGDLAPYLKSAARQLA